ncbi:MAG: hypothetical protein V4556_06370 [Bacteroidota bacterium]
MSHKKVCLECKATLNRSFNDSEQTYPCPKCEKSMILLPSRFRPPKKNDDKKWETVRFLIENGFYYQHVYERIVKYTNGIISCEDFVTYPENIREAKEFVERYKEQAIKK